MKTITVPKWRQDTKGNTTQVGTLELDVYHDLGTFLVTKNKDGRKQYAVTHKVTGIKIRDMNSKELAKDLIKDLSAALPEAYWYGLKTADELQSTYDLIKPVVMRYKAYLDYSDVEYKARRKIP